MRSAGELVLGYCNTVHYIESGLLKESMYKTNRHEIYIEIYAEGEYHVRLSLRRSVIDVSIMAFMLSNS